jgi:hypothetical protein
LSNTTPEALRRQQEMFAAMTPAERVRMGFEMYDIARRLARAGILAEEPALSEREIAQRLFLRMSGDRLPPALVQRTLARIASGEWDAGRPPPVSRRQPRS